MLGRLTPHRGLLCMTNDMVVTSHPELLRTSHPRKRPVCLRLRSAPERANQKAIHHCDVTVTGSCEHGNPCLARHTTWRDGKSLEAGYKTALPSCHTSAPCAIRLNWPVLVASSLGYEAVPQPESSNICRCTS